MRKFVRAYGMDRNCEPSCIVEVEVINDNYAKAYARAKELTRLNDELVYDYEEVTGGVIPCYFLQIALLTFSSQL